MFFTRSGRLSAQDPTAATGDPGAGDGPEPGPGGDRAHGHPGARGGHSGRRRVLGWVVSGLAALFVLFALLTPNEIGRLTPGVFLRVPVEGLLAAALFLLLPERARRAVAVPAGLVLGLLLVLKILDMGFFAVLVRPFHPVLDWSFLRFGVEFLTQSVGRTGALGAALGAALVAAAVPVGMSLSVLRLAGLLGRHPGPVNCAVAVLAFACAGGAVLGVRLVPDVPVSALAYHRALEVRVGLQDQKTFAARVGVDAFRDTPGERLLTGLRGKDVVVAFVESYGRDAVEDPRYGPGIGAVLDAGTRRLKSAGFTSRSAYLTSVTTGAGSVMAHSGMLSGLWVNTWQRYHHLVTTDRLTLNAAFRRAGWRTVGVMPGVTRAWPEGAFYDFHRTYAARDLGYRGPRFPLDTMPDQYTLDAFHRGERARPDHPPVMAEIPLTSSHAPWSPVPRILDWDQIGDGSIYHSPAVTSAAPDAAAHPDAQARADYRRAVEYSLNSLVSYVTTYGDDNLVVLFVGDHQAPLITPEGASWDVPVAIVARDPAVLDRISGWGWQDGLKPGPRAPVWRMDTFRDRFLTTFGPDDAGPGLLEPAQAVSGVIGAVPSRHPSSR